MNNETQLLKNQLTILIALYHLTLQLPRVNQLGGYNTESLIERITETNNIINPDLITQKTYSTEDCVSKEEFYKESNRLFKKACDQLKQELEETMARSTKLLPEQDRGEPND